MDEFTTYYPQRIKAWPAVEQFFGSLPPHLHRRAALLKNDLAILHSDSGQFIDILNRRHDHPLLVLHFWLLADWRVADEPLARHLLPALVFLFAGASLEQLITDASSGFSAADAPLAELLFQQAAVELAQIFPPGSEFWGYYRACWAEYAETRLAAAPQPAAEALLAGRWALAKIPLAAVAVTAGRQADLPQLGALLDTFNRVYQTQSEILALWRDAAQRRLTYPIAQIMAAAGIDPQQPVSPERILGAAVLTGAVARLCQADERRLAEAQLVAEALGVPTLAGYLAAAAGFVQDTGRLFSLKPKKPAVPRAFAPVSNSLAAALSAAEGYLLSDLTFSESWDVQRGGARELTAQAFPAGLVVEALAQTGHPMAEPLARIFAQLHASGCRYYNLPELPPDADDLGLLLRLFGYLPGPAQALARQQLAEPLAQMRASVRPTGEIPVWFAAEPAGSADSPVIWGASCAATEINLLLGLLDFDWPEYAELIQASARSVCHRFETYGLGAALYYVTPYVLWSAVTVLARLRARPIAADLRELLAHIEPTLWQWVEQESRRPHISAQTTAFLALTRPQEAWLEILLKSQRHDGSWPAEPLFLIPHGRRTAWYASRPVTSAFCYLALRKIEQRG